MFRSVSRDQDSLFILVASHEKLFPHDFTSSEGVGQATMLFWLVFKFNILWKSRYVELFPCFYSFKWIWLQFNDVLCVVCRAPHTGGSRATTRAAGTWAATAGSQTETGDRTFQSLSVTSDQNTREPGCQQGCLLISSAALWIISISWESDLSSV